MLLIDTFKLIKSRDEWFQRLDETFNKTLDLLNRGPDAYLESILAQLDAMKRWTAGGRVPTEDERRSMTIPMIITRELDNADNDEIYAYTEQLREVWYYFFLWLDDADFQSMDAADAPVS